MAPSPAPWKWAYSSNAFTRMYLVEAIGCVHDLGFDGIEILADTPHAWPGALDDAAIERISAALERTGLRISNVNANTCRGAMHGDGPGSTSSLQDGRAGGSEVEGRDRSSGGQGPVDPGPYVSSPDPGPTILDPDPAIREVRLRHLEQSLALTSRIGGHVMSFTSGPAPAGGGQVPTSSLQEGPRIEQGPPCVIDPAISGDRSVPAPTSFSATVARSGTVPLQPPSNPQSAIQNPKSEDRSVPAPTAPGLDPDPVASKDLDERVDAALERLLPLAERLGVKLAIEYEPGFYLGTAESTAAVLGRFPTMSLGVNLDLGHAYCVGEDPAAVIHRFGQRILNCHVEDIKGRVHFHLVPGDGDMPWEEIRTALLQIDYRRFLTLELYTMIHDPLGAGRRGLAHLRSAFSAG